MYIFDICMYILYRNLLLEIIRIYFRSMSEYMICQIRITSMLKLPYRGQIPQKWVIFLVLLLGGCCFSNTFCSRRGRTHNKLWLYSFSCEAGQSICLVVEAWHLNPSMISTFFGSYQSSDVYNPAASKWPLRTKTCHPWRVCCLHIFPGPFCALQPSWSIIHSWHLPII